MSSSSFTQMSPWIPIHEAKDNFLWFPKTILFANPEAGELQGECPWVAINFSGKDQTERRRSSVSFVDTNQPDERHLSIFIPTELGVPATEEAVRATKGVKSIGMAIELLFEGDVKEEVIIRGYLKPLHWSKYEKVVLNISCGNPPRHPEWPSFRGWSQRVQPSASIPSIVAELEDEISRRNTFRRANDKTSPHLIEESDREVHPSDPAFECYICIREIGVGRRIVKLEAVSGHCGHEVCRSCAVKWWNERHDWNCPHCRRKTAGYELITFVEPRVLRIVNF